MNSFLTKTIPNPFRVGTGLLNLFNLRIVELAVFFVIVFAAREIADFNYRSNLLIALFIGAVSFQLAGQVFWQYFGRAMNWDVSKSNTAIMWYSSALDVAAALGIVYLTGTIESPFLFLLVVPVFFASHLFSYRIAASVFLSGAVATVAVLGYLEMRGIVPHFDCYWFKNDMYLNTHFYVGTLLVLGGFLSLIIYLSNAFQKHFNYSVAQLRRREEESQVHMHDLSRLYDISLGINAVMTVETLLKMVAKEATMLLSQPWASVVLFNTEKEITHSAMVGISEKYHTRLGTKIRRGGLTEWICEKGEMVVIEDVLADKRASTGEFLLATKIRSLIGLPLSTGAKVIGVIYVGDFVCKKFDRKHLRLLTIMCDQLAIAIAKSKLYESLQRKIETFEGEVENLEKVNHLKSEFVSHVSHELRTPLTSIKAYMEALEKNIDDPRFTEKKEFIGIVSKETERLIRIVNDILDVSKIEFGQRPMQRSVFAIEEVIRDVGSMLKPKLSDKKITLDIDLPENLSLVNADKDLMSQVFINLISNAVKYSPDGTTIKVSGKEQVTNLLISIQDEGIGIPKAQVEKIFDRYFRVKSQHSRHYDGVGLGLAIVKNIIDQHEGTISVDSTENVGSRFTLMIPKEPCLNDLLGFISEGVSSKGALHEMLKLIVRMISELLNAKIVSLMLMDTSRLEMFIKVSYGLDEWIVEQTRVKVGEGIAGKVAETGMPLLIDNIEKNEVFSSPNNPQYETMSLLSVPIFVNNLVVGVINVNNKTSGAPFDQDDMNLLTSFGERISKALERLRDTDDGQSYLSETIDAYKKMLDKQIMTKTIEAKVDLAVKVSRKLGLPEKEVKVNQYVASVHDIGMTRISDEILDKTFALTEEELQQIHSHPEKSTELIRPLEFVELVSNIILHHHERVDGMGYPMGLKGSQIPVGARILAVIDAYQAMTTEQPYRDKKSPQDAVSELVECAGKQFDAQVIEHFIQVLAETGRLPGEQAKEFGKMLKGVVQSTSH